MRAFVEKFACWILGVLLMLALLEALLRLLPVAMGLYSSENAKDWPLHNYEPGLSYTYSTTWAMLNAQRGTTNNYGHLAPFDFIPGSRPIIVIGDSYVESQMNPYSDTLQGQLGKKLANTTSVYGLGVSGLSVSDYLVLAGQARQEFNPVAAVFVIIDGDFSESLSKRSGNFWLQISGETTELQYAPLSRDSLLKKIRKIIGDSSLYRYLQVNLKFSPSNIIPLKFWQKPTAKPVDRAVQNLEQQRFAVDWFLKNLPKKLGLPPKCTVFLIDGDRYALYDPKHASHPKDMPETRTYFIDRATLLGFRVADLNQTFIEAYGQVPLKFDHWPIDRHWNRRGHGIAAAEAYRLLVSDTGNSCLPSQRSANSQ